MNTIKICDEIWEGKMINALSTYADNEAFRLAEKIDEKMSLLIKPKPWYIPNWLYRKIIKKIVTLIIKS